MTARKDELCTALCRYVGTCAVVTMSCVQPTAVHGLEIRDNVVELTVAHVVCSGG